MAAVTKLISIGTAKNFQSLSFDIKLKAPKYAFIPEIIFLIMTFILR